MKRLTNFIINNFQRCAKISALIFSGLTALTLLIPFGAAMMESPVFLLLMMATIASVILCGLNVVKTIGRPGITVAAICVMLSDWALLSLLFSTALTRIAYTVNADAFKLVYTILGLAPFFLFVGSIVLIFALISEKASSEESKKAILTCFGLIMGFALASAIAFIIDQAVLKAEGFGVTRYQYSGYSYSTGGYDYNNQYYSQDGIYVYNGITGVNWMYGKAVRCFLPQVFRMLLNIAAVVVSAKIIKKNFKGIKLQKHGKKVIGQVFLGLGILFFGFAYLAGVMSTVSETSQAVWLNLLNVLLPITSITAYAMLTISCILIMQKGNCSFKSRMWLPILAVPMYLAVFYGLINTGIYYSGFSASFVFASVGQFSQLAIFILSLIISFFGVVFYYRSRHFNITILMAMLILFLEYYFGIAGNVYGESVFNIIPALILCNICIILAIVWVVKLSKSQKISLDAYLLQNEKSETAQSVKNITPNRKGKKGKKGKK